MTKEIVFNESQSPTSSSTLFGTPSTTASTMTSATPGFSFGAPTTAAPGPTPTVTFNLATPATTASTLGSLSFGTSTNIPITVTTTTTAGATGTSFALPSATSALGSLFGTTTAPGLAATTAAASSTTSGGLTLNFGLSSSTAGTATPAKLGLGGLPAPTASGTGTSTDKSSDNKAVKQAPLPNEILQTVENFKKKVTEQKSEKEEISRITSCNMTKLQDELKCVHEQLANVRIAIARNAAAVLKLKEDMATELKYADIAQRTKDLPGSLQFENSAPTEYFINLVGKFETQIIRYQRELEQLENYLSTAADSLHNPQAIVEFMKRLHETFLTIASKLYAVHEEVRVLKEKYSSYRRTYLADGTDIFAPRGVTTSSAPGSREPCFHGPSPFDGTTSLIPLSQKRQFLGGPSNFGESTQPIVGGFTAAPPTTGFSSAGSTAAKPFSLSGGTTFSFGGTDLSTTAQPTAFKLQSPPAGSKRGKK